MKAAFYTLGCKVNQYETQIMEQKLKNAGYEIVPPESAADVYIVNSCTVTAESDRKTRQVLRRFKLRNPKAITVLTGCFPQSAEKSALEIKQADIITGTKGRADIAELISEAESTGKRIVRVSSYGRHEHFEAMKADNFCGHTRAFVKIEDGCEKYCSYCIIPKARGPVRSKPPADIRQELDSLAEKGYKEAVLVGIDLSAYGKDCSLMLSDALSCACESRIARVRLGSLEPNVITEAFVNGVIRLKKICPHFHLSLQSGCAATLKRMNRHYTPERYREAVDLLRRKIPGCAVTTDIIVGFPGETENEFMESLNFAKEIGFARAHVFPYSRRTGTRAALMPSQVPKAEKARRGRIMSDACGAAREKFLETHVGKTLPVLFEKGKSGGYEGFTPDYVTVKASSNIDIHGKIIDTFISGCENGECTGIIPG